MERKIFRVSDDGGGRYVVKWRASTTCSWHQYPVPEVFDGERCDDGALSLKQARKLIEVKTIRRKLVQVLGECITLCSESHFPLNQVQLDVLLKCHALSGAEKDALAGEILSWRVAQQRTDEIERKLKSV